MLLSNVIIELCLLSDWTGRLSLQKWGNRIAAVECTIDGAVVLWLVVGREEEGRIAVEFKVHVQTQERRDDCKGEHDDGKGENQKEVCRHWKDSNRVAVVTWKGGQSGLTFKAGQLVRGALARGVTEELTVQTEMLPTSDVIDWALVEGIPHAIC